MKATRPFTLTELLAILVCLILLALFLPRPCGKATDRSRLISCYANLKQLALSATIYVQDYNDTFPLIAPHYSQKYINLDSPGDSWYGILNVYVSNERSFVCPADKFQCNAKDLMGDDQRFQLSYGFNAVCDATSEASYGTWSNVAPTLKCENPAATLMIGDAGKVHGVLYPFTGDKTEASGHLASRHRINRYGGCFPPYTHKFNAAFFDGHAESFTVNQTSLADGSGKIKLGLTSTAY